jgi:hypothetical protein
MTPRWREMDSNPKRRGTEGSNFRSLQRRVCCEPNFWERIPPGSDLSTLLGLPGSYGERYLVKKTTLALNPSLSIRQ